VYQSCVPKSTGFPVNLEEDEKLGGFVKVDRKRS
jgi:hypothetical protein